MNDRPFVSLIIPMRNEEEYIGACLDSILANDYPQDRLEIILVDDRSTDRSREIVMGYRDRAPFIRLMESVKRLIPAALNIGLKEAKGEIVVRMDAHSTYAPDYVRLCVGYLEGKRADCVGGLQRGEGTTPLTRAIAAAMASRIGAGGAAYRKSSVQKYVDTVFLGAWRRETLDRLRRPDGTIFNELLAANEDYELNFRLRAMGGRILLAPDIVSTYFVRSSLSKLASQYFRYGKNKIIMLSLHPRSVRPRQIAAPALVLGMALSLPLAAAGWAAGWILPGTYALALLIASALSVFDRGFKIAFLMPAAFAIMHLGWGTGFIAGIPRALTMRLQGASGGGP